MHTCRWHPRLPCLVVAECVSCSDTDVIDSNLRRDGKPYQQTSAGDVCVRLDALRWLRATAAALATHLAARDL